MRLPPSQPAHEPSRNVEILRVTGTVVHSTTGDGWVRYRTVICAVLIAWIAATAAWAFRPWPDHVPLTTPDGVESQAARFECGPPLGDPTAVLSDERSSEHRLSRLPCVYRDERRSLAFVNFGLAAAGLVLVGWLTVRSRAATGRRVEPVGPRA